MCSVDASRVSDSDFRCFPGLDLGHCKAQTAVRCLGTRQFLSMLRSLNLHASRIFIEIPNDARHFAVLQLLERVSLDSLYII